MLVDVTKDVTGAKYEYTACAPAEITPKTDTIKDEDIATAVQMIKEAKRPFIFTGGGTIISEASREVTELAHRIDAPVCDSLMGKGGFSGEDPLYTGMLGMHGTKTSNLGVSGCDLLIVLGARFSDRVTGKHKRPLQKNAKILQIDVDAAEINKNIVVDASVVRR